MSQSIKVEKLTQRRERISSEEQAIANLKELLQALQQHKGKLIDARFFEQHFGEKNEYRTWTKYRLSKPSYSFDRHAYEIHISRDCKLELVDRETAHVIEAVHAEIAKLEGWIASGQKAIARLEALDEEALVKDLQALFEKYLRDEEL